MKFDTSYFLCVIGMVLIIEAVPYILFPRGLKSLAKYIERIPETWIQIAGILCAISGLAIIYIARNT